jgi:hypothetical protein
VCHFFSSSSFWSWTSWIWFTLCNWFAQSFLCVLQKQTMHLASWDMRVGTKFHGRLLSSVISVYFWWWWWLYHCSQQKNVVFFVGGKYRSTLAHFNTCLLNNLIN